MRKLLIIYSLFFLYSESVAQSNCTQYYYGEEVIALEEDSTFLWIGSKNDGLIRFNKQTQIKTTYDTLNSTISSNYIHDLLYYNNELIISTGRKLLKFNNGSFIVLNDTIRGKLISDTTGNLIIAGKQGADNWLYYFNGTSFIQQVHVNGLGFTNVDITMDNDGTIWIVRDEFYNADVIKINDTIQEAFNNNNTNAFFSAINPYATSITSFGNNVWASFNSGVYRYDGTDWQLEHKTLLPDGTIIDGLDTMKQFINAMRFDNDGTLWCGTLPTSFQNVEIELLYKKNGNWNFIPQIDLQNTTITDIHISKYTDHIYCGSTEGFIIVDKQCLGIVNNLNILEPLISVQVYPNPAHESINVKVNNSNIESINLTNLDGKIIRVYTKGLNQINLQGIPSGTYILNVISDKGRGSETIIIK